MLAKLLTFDVLITPSIIKFLFYIGIAASIIESLGIISYGVVTLNDQFWLGFSYIFGGLFLILLGIIGSRVVAEMILVLFMIRDELAWQRQQRQEIHAE